MECSSVGLSWKPPPMRDGQKSETLNGKLGKCCELGVRHLCHFSVFSWRFQVSFWHSVWWSGFGSLELMEIRMCWQLFQVLVGLLKLLGCVPLPRDGLCGLLGKHSCVCAGAVGKQGESKSGFLSCWKSWTLTVPWLQQGWWAESLNCFSVANIDWHFCVCFWKKHLTKQTKKKPSKNNPD